MTSSLTRVLNIDHSVLINLIMNLNLNDLNVESRVGFLMKLVTVDFKFKSLL